MSDLSQGIAKAQDIDEQTEHLPAVVRQAAVAPILLTVPAALEALSSSALPANAVLPAHTVLPANTVELRSNLPERRKPGRALWAGSVAALAAASFLDAHSSWGKYEGNSALAGSRGQFGTRGAALKAGINSAWIFSQILALRRGGSHRAFTIANLAAAGFFAASACHNYGISRPQ